MDEIVFSSATNLASAIRNRDISAVEALEAHMAQIEKHNASLNAIVTLDHDQSHRRAVEADRALAHGEIWGPLHGIPMTLKDGFATAGMRTTAGFPPLSSYVPAEDSTVAARLKKSGAIIIGKTNVPVMLGDRQSDNPIFGRTNNPWNPDRTPGGSSGGAAAALAAGMTPLEIGSDIGGSVRTPAQFCGVSALKTTERRVSLRGHIPVLPGTKPLMRFIATIGPMARTVEDLMLGYGIIAGADGYDTDVPPVAVAPFPDVTLADLKVAWAASFPDYPVARSVQSAVRNLAHALRPECSSVVEALPELDFLEQHQAFESLVGSILSVADPSIEPDSVPIQSLDDYFSALNERDQVIRIWEQFLGEWDVLLCPVSMTTAFPHWETGAPLPVDDTMVEYSLGNAYSKLFNYTGHPAVVLPFETDADGLPTGVMLVGKRWGEERLLAIARAITVVSGGFRRPRGF